VRYDQRISTTQVRIIACIDEPEVIEKILRHLGLDGGSSGGAMARAPPTEAGLID